MITTVPDKRTLPLWDPLWSPWAHLPLHWSSSDPLIQKTVLGAKLFTYIHVASLRAGTKRYLERSEVGYLRFLTSRHTKMGQGAKHLTPPLTKKLSYSSQYSSELTGTKCDANFSLGIITAKPLPLIGYKK